jgi:hypothetical protein
MNVQILSFGSTYYSSNQTLITYKMTDSKTFDNFTMDPCANGDYYNIMNNSRTLYSTRPTHTQLSRQQFHHPEQRQNQFNRNISVKPRYQPDSYRGNTSQSGLLAKQSLGNTSQSGLSTKQSLGTTSQSGLLDKKTPFIKPALNTGKKSFPTTPDCTRSPFTTIFNNGHDGKHSKSCMWISIAQALAINHKKGFRDDTKSAIELRDSVDFPDESIDCEIFAQDRSASGIHGHYIQALCDLFNLAIFIFAANYTGAQKSCWLGKTVVSYTDSVYNVPRHNRIAIVWFDGHYELVVSRTSETSRRQLYPEDGYKLKSFRYIPENNTNKVFEEKIEDAFNDEFVFSSPSSPFSSSASSSSSSSFSFSSSSSSTLSSCSSSSFPTFSQSSSVLNSRNNSVDTPVTKTTLTTTTTTPIPNRRISVNNTETKHNSTPTMIQKNREPVELAKLLNMRNHDQEQNDKDQRYEKIRAEIKNLATQRDVVQKHLLVVNKQLDELKELDMSACESQPLRNIIKKTHESMVTAMDTARKECNALLTQIDLQITDLRQALPDIV